MSTYIYSALLDLSDLEFDSLAHNAAFNVFIDKHCHATAGRHIVADLNAVQM